MEFLNEVQQFWAHTGSHKRTAILARRFCQSGILPIEAPSKYPIIARRFGSTGSFHGIPPNFRGMMTQNNTEGQDLNESLVTSGRTAKIAAGQRDAGKMTEKDMSKSPLEERWRKGLGKLPPLI